MQDQQKSFEKREFPPLILGEKQPKLPPLPPPPPPGTLAAPISPEDKQKAADAQGKADDAFESALSDPGSCRRAVATVEHNLARSAGADDDRRPSADARNLATQDGGQR